MVHHIIGSRRHKGEGGAGNKQGVELRGEKKAYWGVAFVLFPTKDPNLRSKCSRTLRDGKALRGKGKARQDGTISSKMVEGRKGFWWVVVRIEVNPLSATPRMGSWVNRPGGGGGAIVTT